jgi:two-component system sensor histidine kinase DesK
MISPSDVRTWPRWLQPSPDSVVGQSIRRGKAPWSDAIHLMWSCWVFITPLFSGGYTLSWLGFTALTYPVFLALYARSMTAPRRDGWKHAVAIIALSALFLRWYPAGLNYFVFGCVILRTGSTNSLLRYVLVLEAVNLAMAAYAYWLGYPWQALVWIPVLSTVVGVIVYVERQSQLREAELMLSQAEVRRLAATAERERIGRDLHDLLGHTLSLITLKLELSRKLLDRDPEAARRELLEAERVARNALAEVRGAVTGYRAADLAAELASARLLVEASGIHFDYDPPPSGLAPACESDLSLVLREAATNIVRHARAARASVRFGADGEAIVMTVEDDGRGGRHVDGNGLRGMRERVAAIGGTMSIDGGGDGRGTRLLVRVPCPRNDTEASAAARARAL